MVDLERREVVDILQDPSADSTASWLGEHPTIEIVSRDRCGLYAQGTARGAQKARQVADRFHLIQNLRHAIEQQLGRAPRPCLQIGPSGTVDLPEPPGLIHRYGPPEVTERRHLVQAGHRARPQVGFDRVKALQADGRTLAEIVRATGLHWHTVRRRSADNTSTDGDYLWVIDASLGPHRFTPIRGMAISLTTPLAGNRVPGRYH